MKVNFLMTVMAIASTTCACGGPVMPEPSEQVWASPIAQCGAGVDQSVSAQVTAELRRSGGEVDAGVKQAAKAAIFGLDGITSGDKQRMYDSYIRCLLARTAG